MREPYTAVIFSSVRKEGDNEAYAAASERMSELAKQQPGYIDAESVRDPATRFGITVSYWRSAEHARAWKAIEEHRAAQRSGKDRWYLHYTVRIATVERHYEHRLGRDAHAPP